MLNYKAMCNYKWLNFSHVVLVQNLLPYCLLQSVTLVLLCFLSIFSSNVHISENRSKLGKFMALDWFRKKCDANFINL